MLASAYADIVYLQRPVSRRQGMDVGHRAKQFAPFAALRGFEETVRKKEIIYEKKKELPDDKKSDIDRKLRILSYGMNVQVTFYKKSSEVSGKGQHHTVNGKVEFFDPSIYLRIGNTEINIQDITDIKGDIFEKFEQPC